LQLTWFYYLPSLDIPFIVNFTDLRLGLMAVSTDEPMNDKQQRTTNNERANLNYEQRIYIRLADISMDSSPHKNRFSTSSPFSSNVKWIVAARISTADLLAHTLIRLHPPQ
jgi:hypothetical protein